MSKETAFKEAYRALFGAHNVEHYEKVLARSAFNQGWDAATKEAETAIDRLKTSNAELRGVIKILGSRSTDGHVITQVEGVEQ